MGNQIVVVSFTIEGGPSQKRRVVATALRYASTPPSRRSRNRLGRDSTVATAVTSIRTSCSRRFEPTKILPQCRTTSYPRLKKHAQYKRKKRKECASLITHTLQHSRTGSSIERSRETVCQLILLKRRLKNSKYRKGRYS